MSQKESSDVLRKAREFFSENPLDDMPELFEAALDEFSTKSFVEASLNDMIKRAKSNKGSFYYRFTDKLDLYICVFDKIAKDKMAYFAAKAQETPLQGDFFELYKSISRLGLEFARHEPRYYKLWRRYLAEGLSVKVAIKKAFPDEGSGLESYVEAAYHKGQFKTSFSLSFLKSIINLLSNHLDMLLTEEMSDDEMMKTIDNLMEMLKDGIAVSR